MSTQKHPFDATWYAKQIERLTQEARQLETLHDNAPEALTTADLDAILSGVVMLKLKAAEYRGELAAMAATTKPAVAA